MFPTDSEPIAGDENPESYGAAGEGGVPSLSTDGVLANNLRRVNYVYRNGQLMPNARIPGFMSHQSERSFDDGMGPAQQNYSDVHLRDFDIRGSVAQFTFTIAHCCADRIATGFGFRFSHQLGQPG